LFAWVPSPRLFLNHLFKEIEMNKILKHLVLTIAVIITGLYLLSPVVTVAPQKATVSYIGSFTPQEPMPCSYTWAG
jgi:hypothetical protein